MKYLFITILLGALSISTLAEECPSFTPEQSYLLGVAYIIGNQANEPLHTITKQPVGHTMAAILWKESFIQEKIFRYNPHDPSYGVMNVTFRAYLETQGIRDMSYSTIQSHTNIINTLLTDDFEAIKIGYKYLSNKIILHKDLWKGVKGYNGAGWRATAYMNDVKDRVKLLSKCKTFDNIYM